MSIIDWAPDTKMYTKEDSYYADSLVSALRHTIMTPKIETTPTPRYIAMPPGRSLVAPVVTEDGYGQVEYELERRHFTYRVPLDMMWMNTASPADLKSKQVIEYMLEKAWAGGSRLSEKLHNIANIIRSIEDGMVQEETK